MGDIGRGIHLARGVRSFSGKFWECCDDEWERLRIYDVPMESEQKAMGQETISVYMKIYDRTHVLALTYDIPSKVRKISDTGKL